MFVNPKTLSGDLDTLEGIEKGSLRLAVQALFDFRDDAFDIVKNEKDKIQDIGEDITREALDRIGMSKIDDRLFGNIDYKRARYVFNKSYAVRQALLVDSKAEKVSGQGTATIQTAQTSMRIRLIRSGKKIDEPGKLKTVLQSRRTGFTYLSTTIFVKYNYKENGGNNKLVSVTVFALPNGMLQGRYNPSPTDTIWLVGRDAPTRKEAFRVRVSLSRLKRKMCWRVQEIPVSPTKFIWDD